MWKNLIIGKFTEITNNEKKNIYGGNVNNNYENTIIGRKAEGSWESSPPIIYGTENGSEPSLLVYPPYNWRNFNFLCIQMIKCLLRTFCYFTIV